MTPANVEAALESNRQGKMLVLHYHGPIVDRRRLYVRYGECREGHEWLEPRDLEMVTTNGEAVAEIPYRATEPVEGACFAFYAQTSTEGGETVWDNAGKPFGYYAFDARTGRIEAR